LWSRTVKFGPKLSSSRGMSIAGTDSVTPSVVRTGVFHRSLGLASALASPASSGATSYSVSLGGAIHRLALSQEPHCT